MSTRNYDRSAGRQGGANAGNTKRTGVFAFSKEQREAVRDYTQAKAEEKKLMDLVKVQVYKQQIACYLMLRRGLTPKHIGEIVGLSPQAVRERIEHGRILMGEDTPDEPREKTA